jgi:hypothetical protein
MMMNKYLPISGKSVEECGATAVYSTTTAGLIMVFIIRINNRQHVTGNL